MPFFPEALYLLSDRDQQVTWLDPVLFEANVSLAQLNVISAFIVPTGRLLLLQNAVGDFAAGAAQTVSNAQIVVRPVATPNPYTLIAVNYYGPAVQQRFINWSGSIVVPPGWQVQADGVFSAAAAANYVDLAISGLLIPIGNVQRV